MNAQTVGQCVNGKYVSTPTTAKQKARFAEMLALRSPPKAMTDREFFEGRGTLDKQFEGNQEALDRVIKPAMKRGYKPNPNDVYTPALAAYPGDPKAFVPATGGRGHIEKVIRDRGWSIEGAVNVKGERRPVKRKRLGDDLVKEEVCNMVRENPDLRKVSKWDLAAEAIHKHGNKETE